MDVIPHPASVEFLQFIADISDPATGEIRARELAAWLHVPESDLYDGWISREKHVPWAVFVDELLSVLDAVQDRTQSLEQTMQWFLHASLADFDMKTPKGVVVTGRARVLVRSIRNGEIPVKI